MAAAPDFVLHEKDLLSVPQATTQLPWGTANDPHNEYRSCHALLTQPVRHSYLHGLSGPLDNPYLILPMTYSADGTDMHCLGVVTGVEQAICLQ